MSWLWILPSLHRKSCTFQTSLTSLPYPQVLSSVGIRVGIASHTTGKNQFACKAPLIISVKLLKEAFRIVELVWTLRLTFDVFKTHYFNYPRIFEKSGHTLDE